MMEYQQRKDLEKSTRDFLGLNGNQDYKVSYIMPSENEQAIKRYKRMLERMAKIQEILKKRREGRA